MIAALPIHENGNCRNVRAELDGHGSAGAVLIWDVILRGWVDLRINHAGHDIPGGSVGRGAPALTPRATGPATPSRSNTDQFPPSRLLPPTQGAVSTQQTQTPGSTGTPSASGAATTNQSTTPGGTLTTPGGTATTRDGTSTAMPDASTSGTQGSGTAATTDGRFGNGQSSASGSTGPTRPVPPNSQTSSGSSQTPATRTGKNSLNDTVADCMRLWDSATHMSKADWRRTCRRVQGRLDQVTKQVLER
jgi:hypothetical protein